MSDISGEQVTVSVPAGWEGRVTGRPVATTAAVAAADASGAPAPDERTVVLQVASFPIPADMGDFGGGATPTMGPNDVLVVLFEHGSESVGTPLFAAQGIPTLRPNDFSPFALRLMLEGQSGVQRFFTVAGRAFCLYAVIGSHRRRIGLCGVVNDVLRSARIT